jgi:hypothetical protein
MQTQQVQREGLTLQQISTVECTSERKLTSEQVERFTPEHT